MSSLPSSVPGPTVADLANETVEDMKEVLGGYRDMIAGARRARLDVSQWEPMVESLERAVSELEKMPGLRRR